MKKSIVLRNRGQITLPKNFLDSLGASENDNFVAKLSGNTITLEYKPKEVLNLEDSLEIYIINDLKKRGLNEDKIKEIMPVMKDSMEKKYLEYLKDKELHEEFEEFEEWDKNNEQV